MKIFSFLLCLIITQTYSNTSIVLEKDGDQNNKKYKLVWSDEFNYEGTPDANKWGYETGFVRNQESQYYTRRKKNARIENGNLIIESHREKYKNRSFKSKTHKNWRLNKKFTEYTSASLTTKRIADWKYAKVEVRAKLPKGKGSWSAIWLLGENKNAEYGEIDIMENVGFAPNTINGTIHSKTIKNNKFFEKSGKVKIASPSTKYHIYSVEWTPREIKFSVNGKVYHRVTKVKKNKFKWNFDQAFHLKINNAIGGIWGRKMGIDKNSFPQKMYIDYVRVFQIMKN